MRRQTKYLLALLWAMRWPLIHNLGFFLLLGAYKWFKPPVWIHRIIADLVVVWFLALPLFYVPPLRLKVRTWISARCRSNQSGFS